MTPHRPSEPRNSKSTVCCEPRHWLCACGNPFVLTYSFHENLPTSTHFVWVVFGRVFRLTEVCVCFSALFLFRVSPALDQACRASKGPRSGWRQRSCRCGLSPLYPPMVWHNWHWLSPLVVPWALVCCRLSCHGFSIIGTALCFDALHTCTYRASFPPNPHFRPWRLYPFLSTLP